MRKDDVRGVKEKKAYSLLAVSPCFPKCRGTESNRRHGDFQSPALPTELPRLKVETVLYPIGPTMSRCFLPHIAKKKLDEGGGGKGGGFRP